MKNKIEYVLPEEMQELKNVYVQSPSCRIIEMEGENFATFNDVMEYLEVKLNFPRKCEGNGDRFCDWMRDLLWYPFEQYVFVVWNYKNFVWHEWADKGLFFQSFEEILRFWEFGAEKCIVGGKPKEMHVYLVMEDTY